MPGKSVFLRGLFFAVICFFFLVPGMLNAQNAAELDTILASKAVNYAQAARFVLASTAGDTSGAAGRAQDSAFEQAVSRGWLPKGAAAGDEITMGSLSFMLMKAFDLKGGIMYKAAPGPRYAYRSMVNRSVIQGASDPAMKVSGERFLQILGNALRLYGAE